MGYLNGWFGLHVRSIFILLQLPSKVESPSWKNNKRSNADTSSYA